MAVNRERVTLLDWRETPPAECRNGIIAIGNFDGVHRGHAALVKLARSLGSPVVILSFDPHPLQLLAPEKFLPPLMTPEARAVALLEVGADAVVFLRTDREMLSLAPREFFQRILIEQFGARGIVEGFNFRFGKDRTGTIDLLHELSNLAGIPIRVVEPFELGGSVVSSSKVRDALTSGDVRLAQRLMARSYELVGRVIEGARRGRTIGFPTANLGGVKTLIPAEGVYAVRAFVNDQEWPGAANIGSNPTFGEHARKIEIYLIGFTGDLYGTELRVEFIERLRETRKFNGPDELIKQMKNDVARAAELAGEQHAGG